MKNCQVKINHKVYFNTHINEICKKVGQKLNALSMVTPYMDLSKRRMLVNTFLLSQITQFPLVWMWNSRIKSNKI